METLKPIFSVTELNTYIDLVLGNEPNLKQLVVEGEISACKRHPSGHLYFTLQDASSSVPCVMWKQQTHALRFLPKEGMRVRLNGRASLYGRDGRFQLYANALEKCGEGDLMQAFLRYKAELEQKGYFDAAHKKPIPALPTCVGVVTSSSGAALQDIRSVVKRRFPSMPIVVYAAAVQGENAAKELAAAIEQANREKRADVLIVGRGGGSMEDLWAFNEPEVTEAVYRSELPIVSAVGHETDTMLTDFVADLRAPTPSAAAELVVPEEKLLWERLTTAKERLERSMENGWSRKRDRLELIMRGSAWAEVPMRLERSFQRLMEAEVALMRAETEQSERLLHSLSVLGTRLHALSPMRWSERGFALLYDPKGNPITKADMVQKGDTLTLQFADGKVFATVDGKEMK